MNIKKYLDMENATLEINLDNVHEYIDFLEKSHYFILNQNFKRIILHCNQTDIFNLYNNIKIYFIDSDILIMIYSDIIKNIEYNMEDNFLIVNTNEKMIIEQDNIFNIINFNSKNFKKIIKLISLEKNIIVKLEINPNNISKFNSDLLMLFNNAEDKDINIDGYIIMSELIREHPCNSYLCNGWKCGKKISCLPRHILIDNNFNIYPHDLKYKKLYIGNCKFENLDLILEKYMTSKEYINFVNYNKKVFIKYLSTYPYQFMPLIEYIRMEAENDK